LIFFDLDGTLIDHKQAEILGVHGFLHEYKEYFNFKEDLFYEHWCKISNKHFARFLNRDISFLQQQIERIKDVFILSGIKLSDNEAAKKFKVYLELYEENLMPYDDVLPCLNSLKDKRLGIISNGALKQQLLKLSKIGNEICFDPIIVAEEVGVAKPNIDIFRIACIKANVQAKDCIYVGDDFKTDILSCSTADMNGIWLNRYNQESINSTTKMIQDLRMLKNYLQINSIEL